MSQFLQSSIFLPLFYHDRLSCGLGVGVSDQLFRVVACSPKRCILYAPCLLLGKGNGGELLSKSLGALGDATCPHFGDSVSHGQSLAILIQYVLTTNSNSQQQERWKAPKTTFEAKILKTNKLVAFLPSGRHFLRLYLTC